MVIWPVCLGVKHPSGAQERCLLLSVAGLLMWGALSDKRMSLLFTVAPGPCQCSHFPVRVSYLRLHQPGGPGPHINILQQQGGPVMLLGTGFFFSPPPTTLRAMM
jgi:hypothetical protein